MKEIGGYFGLELNPIHHFPHENCVLVNSGRNALEYILKGIGRVRKLYIPYYTCDVVLQPIIRLGIEYTFYHINQNLGIGGLPQLSDNEYIIVNNYFGVKDSYIKGLCDALEGKIIVDNSQALFTPIYNKQPTFWSPRKFVGIPDGGIAYPSYNIEIHNRDISSARCSHLLKRCDSGASSGYADFRDNSAQLKDQSVKHMSNLTLSLLRSIDFDRVCHVRKKNYDFIRSVLESSNLLSTPTADDIACPMVYPYMTDDSKLRKKLIDNKIFVATYWPNVSDWCTENQTENLLAKQILPLPIDQRYDKDDMCHIINVLSK